MVAAGVVVVAAGVVVVAAGVEVVAAGVVVAADGVVVVTAGVVVVAAGVVVVTAVRRGKGARAMFHTVSQSYNSPLRQAKPKSDTLVQLTTEKVLSSLNYHTMAAGKWNSCANKTGQVIRITWSRGSSSRSCRSGSWSCCGVCRCCRRTSFEKHNKCHVSSESYKEQARHWHNCCRDPFLDREIKAQQSYSTNKLTSE